MEKSLMDTKEQVNLTAIKVEGFRVVTQAAKEAIKSATLINGGAAVALLAFLGGTEKDSALVSGIAGAMMIFTLGVLLAAVAAGGMYCTQWCYEQEKWEKWGNRFRLGSILLVGGSYILLGSARGGPILPLWVREGPVDGVGALPVGGVMRAEP